MAKLEANPMQDLAEERVYDPAPRVRPRHVEGTLTRLLEQQAAKLPSGFFLATALAAMAVSAGFELRGDQRWSRFFGMWAPTLLIAGVYNKLVKTFGTR